MTKSEEARSIITGSFILYLIDGLLDKSEQFHGSTIRVKQVIRAKTKKSTFLPYAEMSNKAWSIVVDKFKDDKYRVAIFDAVEYLGFEDSEIMTKMFGNNFIPYVSSFALKQTRDGVDDEILKESRIICDELRKATMKVIYDNKKELK